MNRPLLAVTISFIVGIVISGLIEIHSKLLFVLIPVVFCLAAAGYMRFRKGTTGAVLVLFMLLGWLWAGLHGIDNGTRFERYAGHFVTVEGTVAREPEYGSGGKDAIYVLAADVLYLGERRVETRGMVQVKVKGSGPVYDYGRRLRAGGILYRPGEPGNFGAFNYRDYLARRGIGSLMTVNGPQFIQAVDDGGGGNPLVRAALGYKSKLQRVADATLNQRQAAVLGGMLFGSRDRIDRATNDIFAVTGVAHVLCVSGLHVGFILAGVLLAVGALGVPRRAYLFAAVPTLFFYALMTGMGPAVVRAGIMALTVMAAAALNRERDWPSALALAAASLLLVNPALIYEVGFQLSFTATWGILYLGPIIGAFLTRRLPMLPRWLVIPLQVTIAAQLGTLPLLIYYFNLVTPVAPLANLVLVPLVGLIMLAGFLGCVCGLIFMPAAGVINGGTGAVIDLFLALAALMSGIPGGFAYVAAPPWPVIFLWYAGLVILAQWARRQINNPGPGGLNKTVPLVVGVLLGLMVFCPWAGTGGQLQVHFLDVGQGDSILVRFPGGKTMLVDAGGRYGEPEETRVIGDSVVVPYLRHLGLNKLDALVVTHPHEDHAGGVPAVVEKLSVSALVLSHAAEYDAMLAQMEGNRVPVYRVSAGQTLQLDHQVEVLVLAPVKENAPVTGDEPNDDSLVMRLDYKDVSFLLTGDIEERAQRELLARGADIQANVLKVPHHGSRLFEHRFLDAVASEYSVIQVGANNRFGHPAADTVDVLVSSGSRVLRTDINGAVLFSTDGNKIQVRTAKQSALKN